jgi:hypothetical protein
MQKTGPVDLEVVGHIGDKLLVVATDKELTDNTSAELMESVGKMFGRIRAFPVENLGKICAILVTGASN